MEETESVGNRYLEKATSYVSNIVGLVVKVLVILPVKGLTLLILKVRERDPKVNEKTKCPGCGHRVVGRLNFIRTEGPEQGAIEHTCGMCGAKFHSPLILKPEKWLGKHVPPETKVVKELTI